MRDFLRRFIPKHRRRERRDSAPVTAPVLPDGSPYRLSNTMYLEAGERDGRPRYG